MTLVLEMPMPQMWQLTDEWFKININEPCIVGLKQIILCNPIYSNSKWDPTLKIWKKYNKKRYKFNIAPVEIYILLSTKFCTSKQNNQNLKLLSACTKFFWTYLKIYNFMWPKKSILYLALRRNIQDKQ